MGLIKAWCGLFGLMVILQKEQSLAVGRLMGNLLTNEVMEPPKEEEVPELPLCRGGSACGYVQVNAFGVSQQQICRCPSLTSGCPLHWDPEDGHSVTLASQQYKFCEAAPNLPICKRAEPAYTQAILFDQMTFELLGETTSLHCICPPPRTHVFYKAKDDVVDDMQVLGSIYTCSMLPACEFEASCKKISITRTSTLVNNNCQCRHGFVCPTLSPQATPSDMSEEFTNGKVFSVRCQPWY